MSLTLTEIPGFADLPDSSLIADSPALAIYMDRIAGNAGFGMVRMEVFIGAYADGDTVPVPTSPVDKYNYSRDELIYVWAVQSTVASTANGHTGNGWISGVDTLWYAAWLVQQWDDTSGADNSKAGLVSCLEYYRRSGQNANPTKSNDGTLLVFTIAQRLRKTITIASPITSFTDQADSAFVTDAPLKQSMIQGLNDGAKFGVVNAECIYMGEFVNGDTVPRAVSPADGYQYTYAEMKLMASWRWTVGGTPPFTQPSMATGQLAPIKWSINASTGAVSLTVNYVADGSKDAAPVSGFGRVAVFAFCSRANLMGSLSGTGNAFSELTGETFLPGSSLRASQVLQLNRNIREAACSPEFFGPTEYASGDTVPLPTSPIDSYSYSRDELAYVYEWSDTTPASGTHLRTVAWSAAIDKLTGSVGLMVWRLADGGPVVPGLETGQHLRIRVLTIGLRNKAVPIAPGGGGSGTIPGGTPDVPADVKDPYVISYFGGDGASPPKANEVILRHVIPGSISVAEVPIPLNLSGSTAGCLLPPAANFTVTIKRNGTSIGSFTIASGATTATYNFPASVIANPLDIFDFVAPATPDTAISGLFFTIAANHTPGKNPGS